MLHYLNDGSADEPKLRVYLNLDNLADLRPDTLWPELEGDERMVRLRADGFDRVQVTSGEPPSPGVMPSCGLGDPALPTTSNYANSRDTGFEDAIPDLGQLAVHQLGGGIGPH